MTELRLHLAGYADSDAEERAALAGVLRQELLRLDVDDVSHPAADAPPAGAKGSALEWAQLVVTFAGSLPPLIAVVRSWLDRHQGAALTLDYGDESITIPDASPEERAALLDDWLRRHERG